ncbi:MAG TPA: sensor histidine kinase [Casimicrobiaceae bacterium]
MQLSQFIAENIERILQNWEDFARSLERGRDMSITALRDDAERMLRFVIVDMEREQSAQQQFDKSTGRGPQLPLGQHSAAHDHGLGRALEHFTLAELVSEYRALRASVTRMWLDEAAPTRDNVLQLVRFNEAIDQILAEAVSRFSEKLDMDADLLTASVGHDLRNPLNAIITVAQILARGPDSSAAQGAAAQIERSAMRIASMLGELQDFTRTRLGASISYKLQRCNVAEICNAAVAEVAATHRTHQIVCECTGDTWVIADRLRIAQVISNLVANAVQHGARGGTVKVHVAGEPEHIRIEVHNTGTPIQAPHLREIFEPLYQIQRGEGHDPGSLGLGLYIARRIVIAHGGTIEVTSTQTAGTTFVIQLPRKAAFDMTSAH